MIPTHFFRLHLLSSTLMITGMDRG